MSQQPDETEHVKTKPTTPKEDERPKAAESAPQVATGGDTAAQPDALQTPRGR